MAQAVARGAPTPVRRSVHPRDSQMAHPLELEKTVDAGKEYTHDVQLAAGTSVSWEWQSMCDASDPFAFNHCHCVCARPHTAVRATAVSFYYLRCLLAYVFVRFLARTILPTVRVQRCTQPESGHVRFPDFSAGPTTWSSACCLSRTLAMSLSPLLRLPSTLQLPTAGWRLMARPRRFPTVACFVVA